MKNGAHPPPSIEAIARYRPRVARPYFALASALPLLLLASCGRKAAPAPTGAEASPVASALAPEAPVNACPPAPSWAAELPTEAVAEVLHIPAKRANRNGAGYRLFDDGRLDTYTDVELFVNSAGKLETRPGDAVWKTTGMPEASKVEAARNLFSETSREDLEAWAPKQPRKDVEGEWTLIRLRKDDDLVSTCYFGHRGPPPLAALERAVHDLRSSIKAAERAVKEDAGAPKQKDRPKRP